MNYVLLPLEKLDVNNITFGKAKENQYKGINIPLYYKRENKNVPLYIKVKGCVSPFGIKQNTEMHSNKVSGYAVGSNPIWNSDFFRVDVFTSIISLKNFFEYLFYY